jgi:hypothetical protein
MSLAQRPVAPTMRLSLLRFWASRVMPPVPSHGLPEPQNLDTGKDCQFARKWVVLDVVVMMHCTGTAQMRCSSMGFISSRSTYAALKCVAFLSTFKSHALFIPGPPLLGACHQRSTVPAEETRPESSLGKKSHHGFRCTPSESGTGRRVPVLDGCRDFYRTRCPFECVHRVEDLHPGPHTSQL